MKNHGFFDIPNLIPATNAMVSRAKPKFGVSQDDSSVGVINSGNVEMDLQPPVQTVRLRKKRKSKKVKRKLKNKGKSKDKK